VNEAGEERVWGIRAGVLTGVDDHAVGEVGAVRARGPAGGDAPLLHPCSVVRENETRLRVLLVPAACRQRDGGFRFLKAEAYKSTVYSLVSRTSHLRDHELTSDTSSTAQAASSSTSRRPPRSGDGRSRRRSGA
jgi:hypothetical protein